MQSFRIFDPIILDISSQWLLIGFLWGSTIHKFSFLQAKMASEAQKPLTKMEFLLVCG